MPDRFVKKELYFRNRRHKSAALNNVSAVPADPRRQQLDDAQESGGEEEGHEPTTKRRRDVYAEFFGTSASEHPREHGVMEAEADRRARLGHYARYRGHHAE